MLKPLGSNAVLIEELEYDGMNLAHLYHDFMLSFSRKSVVNFSEGRKTRLFELGILHWDEYVSNLPKSYDLAYICSASSANPLKL